MVRRWTLICAALLVAMLAACGSDDDNGTGDTTPSGATATSAASPAATKASGELILATTTSTQDSGLLDALIPMFEEESGYSVKAVAVGSGQAIAQASRGDADVVLAHSPAAEEKMVADGDGIEREVVMHNDFIIVGPAGDPAGVGNTSTANDAMKAIFDAGAPFISRGDDSGTHTLEKNLWSKAQLDPAGQAWYEESGQGMGATLQIANQRQAYTISDRGTYLSQTENLDLDVLNEGDASLLNVYHVIVVNPEKHPDANSDAARAFAKFIVREDIQDFIGQFGVEEFGEPLFFPDAAS